MGDRTTVTVAVPSVSGAVRDPDGHPVAAQPVQGDGAPPAAGVGYVLHYPHGPHGPAEGMDPRTGERVMPVLAMPTPPPRAPEGTSRRKPPVRLEVRRFSLLMELKLRKNDYKGGWQDVSAAKLLELLEGEVKELREALAEGDALDIAQECADIANYAMMIADVTEGI